MSQDCPPVFRRSTRIVPAFYFPILFLHSSELRFPHFYGKFSMGLSVNTDFLTPDKQDGDNPEEYGHFLIHNSVGDCLRLFASAILGRNNPLAGFFRAFL